jgi:hypothetical protein
LNIQDNKINSLTNKTLKKMATTINFAAPELGFGTFGIAKCQVEILDGLTPTSTRLYFFNISEFSAFVDATSTNYASVHFGQHVVNLSNGDYDVIKYDNTIKTTPYSAIADLAEAVAQLAP